MSWKNLLITCGLSQTMQRAQSALRRRTKYKLGKGGFDPTKPLTPECDCSGFVAWAIGIPRELPPGSGKWLSTDEYWAGGLSGKIKLFKEIKLNKSEIGDLLVYPDQGGNQGHIGIITDRIFLTPSSVIHCSMGNYRTHKDAVYITPATVFLQGNHDIRVMRIDYELLYNFCNQLKPAL